MTDTAQSREHEGLTQAEIDELVSQADTGGRSAGPFIGRLIAGIALVWSLFQLWFASPLPFAFGFGVFNDTEARSIHLAFAVVLAFLAFPPAHTAVQTALGVIVPLVLGGLLALSAGDIFPVWVVLLVTIVVAGACALPTRNDRVAIHEWAMAIAGGFCAAYIFLFYRDLADRVVEVRSDDGLHVRLEDGGFVMWRASGTEGVLRVYAEAATQAALDASRRIIVVSTVSVPVVQRTRRMLEILRDGGGSGDSREIDLVVNRLLDHGRAVHAKALGRGHATS